MALRMPTLMQPRCTDCSTTRGPAAGPTAPAGGFSSGTGYRTYSACTVCILDMVPTTQSVIRSLLVMDCSVQDSRCATTQEQANPASHIGPARTAEWLRRGRQVGQSAVPAVMYLVPTMPPIQSPIQSAATCSGNLDTWTPGSQGAKGPRPHSEPDEGKHCGFVVVACCDAITQSRVHYL